MNDFTLETAIKEEAKHRNSFFQLARQVFQLDFQPWYDHGYWSEKYQPYTFFDGTKAVANISVNRMSFGWQGQIKRYIQLGTVMTHPDYRHQGLSAKLMTKVLEDIQGEWDAVFLFANDSVKEFYPKFGFQPAIETQYCMDALSSQPKCRKLNLDDPEDSAFFHQLRLRKEHHNLFPSLDNQNLLMFYCLDLYRDYLYYTEEKDALVIAGYEGDDWICYYISGGENATLMEILTATTPKEVQRVLLGFTPIDTTGLKPEKRTVEDETLFLLEGSEHLFLEHPLIFPLLSHA